MNHREIEKTLVSEEEVKQIVQRLGDEISSHYGVLEKELMVIGLLRGSFIFMADLIRVIKTPLVVDFLTVSSYGDGTESSGDVKVVMDLDSSVEDRDVLLVEDIVDTGRTFAKVITMMKKRNPKSLKICTFLNKPAARITEVQIDFCGVDIPNEFAVGYGLDFAQNYRNLPYVGVLKT
ncbi:hypoxanthine phosphoribosyltransferase [Desulforhopalus singaporensis]|uniref:hypoxanthine phosphoribosyltransferase n=1 Tax=Desulforhopalus singaporensis TaxID=91360 RepID=UPI001FE044C5|nr:hypoxanthine phosphoribosyltransferase [Desulforhopalus singaporensis]